MLDTPPGPFSHGDAERPGREKKSSLSDEPRKGGNDLNATREAPRPVRPKRLAHPYITVQQSAETLQKGSPLQESRRSRTLYLA